MSNYTKKDTKVKAEVVEEKIETKEANVVKDDVKAETETEKEIKDENEDEIKIVIKDEKSEEVKVEKKDETNDMVAMLQRQLMEMQQAMIRMQANQAMPIMSSGASDYDTMYEIGTRFVNGASIYSPNKEVVFDIPFDKTVTVSGADLGMLLKTPFVKDWFAKDIIFFEDENVYTQKKIKKEWDLSDEALTKLINENDTVKTVSTLKDMTKNMRDDVMIHCLFYRIVELCDNGKLSTMPYDTRKQIESMFGFKIDDAQMLFRGFRNIR